MMFLINMAFAYHVCQIHQGDTGKLRYQGSSMEEAMRRTVDSCMEKRVSDYTKKRGHAPDAERQTMFVESCVNSVFCIELLELRDKR